MTVDEMSAEFDLLYNNIGSNQAPGLTEYEKSVFLTKAQAELVKAYFMPASNKTQTGFDDSPIRQADFSTIIKQEKLTELTSEISKFDSRSKVYKYPSDIFISLNEQIQAYMTVDAHRYDTTQYSIVPISYADYSRLMTKPYKYPPKYQVWRLITGKETSGTEASTVTYSKVEIIGRFASDDSLEYKIRYIKNLNPIILENITDTGLTIDGKNEAMASELPSEVHKDIVQRAVELAKAAYTGDLTSQIALGQASGTDKGVVSQGR